MGNQREARCSRSRDGGQQELIQLLLLPWALPVPLRVRGQYTRAEIEAAFGLHLFRSESQSTTIAAQARWCDRAGRCHPRTVLCCRQELIRQRQHGQRDHSAIATILIEAETKDISTNHYAKTASTPKEWPP